MYIYLETHMLDIMHFADNCFKHSGSSQGPTKERR